MGFKSGFNEGPNHGTVIKPPVKTKTKLGKIPGQMLFADRMIGAVDGFLDVAEHGIDPGEHLDLRACIATTGND